MGVHFWRVLFLKMCTAPRREHDFQQNEHGASAKSLFSEGGRETKTRTPRPEPKTRTQGTKTRIEGPRQAQDKPKTNTMQLHSRPHFCLQISAARKPAKKSGFTQKMYFAASGANVGVQILQKESVSGIQCFLFENHQVPEALSCVKV